MADLLSRMAGAGMDRVRAARALLPEQELRRRAAEAPPPVRLRLDPSGFDLIAEVKLRAPSSGLLADPGADPLRLVRERVSAYAAAGAAAVSVLTEPSAFGGALSHLREAAGAAAVPVMRKDFLVDPYQVLEARAAGASGVLLIVKLLDGSRLERMLQACAELGLFALIEFFDGEDAGKVGTLLETFRGGDVPLILLGVNVRDLRTLAVEGDRLEKLVGRLPSGFPRVAESGVKDEADAVRVASLGYGLALVGTALMRAEDPGSKAAAILAAGRAAKLPKGAGRV